MLLEPGGHTVFWLLAAGQLGNGLVYWVDQAENTGEASKPTVKELNN